MPNVPPLERSQLADFEPFFQIAEGAMGFVPRSLFTMGHKPALLQAFAGLTATVLGPGRVEPELKSLVSYVVSRAAGCQYCQAHTSHTAHRNGASEEKIQEAFAYETSPLFSDAERAALRLAHHAGLVPNESRHEHFEALREHFDTEQIVEIVSVVALFGFLNRWNDTMATELEDAPLAFGEKVLSGGGCQAGKHASAG